MVFHIHQVLALPMENPTAPKKRKRLEAIRFKPSNGTRASDNALMFLLKKNNNNKTNKHFLFSMLSPVCPKPLPVGLTLTQRSIRQSANTYWNKEDMPRPPQSHQAGGA